MLPNGSWRTSGYLLVVGASYLVRVSGSLLAMLIWHSSGRTMPEPMVSSFWQHIRAWPEQKTGILSEFW